MADEEATTTAVPPPNESYALDVMLGMMDSLIAFGVVLANSGLISRESIAATMTVALDQQRQGDGETHPGRKIPLETLRIFFSTPVFKGNPN